MYTTISKNCSFIVSKKTKLKKYQAGYLKSSASIRTNIYDFPKKSCFSDYETRVFKGTRDYNEDRI